MKSDKKTVGLQNKQSATRKQQYSLKSVLQGRKFNIFSHSNIGDPKNKNEANSIFNFFFNNVAF